MKFPTYIINEGKLVTVKRRYTDNHPEQKVAAITPVREKVLAFVGERGRVSKSEFVEFLRGFNEEAGRNTTFAWVRKNKHLFDTVRESGSGELQFRLSKFGKRVLEKTKINESVDTEQMLNEDYTDSLIKLTAKKLGADLTPYDLKQVKIGMAVELKHGTKFGDVSNITKDDPELTMKLVLGNLMVNPKYYTDPKPEDWGEIETEMDRKGSVEKAAEDNEEEVELEEPDEIEIKLDDDKQKDNKEVDNPENKEGEKKETEGEKKEEETKGETSDEKPAESSEISPDEKKKKMVEFLQKVIDEGITGDAFVSKLTLLAKELNMEYDDLKKEIYGIGFKAIKEDSVDVNIEDLSDEAQEKMEKKIGDEVQLTDDLIQTLAKEAGIEEKLVRRFFYEAAKLQLAKQKLTKDESEINAADMPEDLKKKEQVKESTTGFLTTDAIDKNTPDKLGKYNTKKMLTLDDFLANRMIQPANESELNEAKAQLWTYYARHNPQLGVYYKFYKEPLSAAEFKRKEKAGLTGYGSNYYYSFATKEELEAEFAKLEAKGERVSWTNLL